MHIPNQKIRTKTKNKFKHIFQLEYLSQVWEGSKWNCTAFSSFCPAVEKQQNYMGAEQCHYFCFCLYERIFSLTGKSLHYCRVPSPHHLYGPCYTDGQGWLAQARCPEPRAGLPRPVIPVLHRAAEPCMCKPGKLGFSEFNINTCRWFLVADWLRALPCLWGTQRWEPEATPHNARTCAHALTLKVSSRFSLLPLRETISSTVFIAFSSSPSSQIMKGTLLEP